MCPRPFILAANFQIRTLFLRFGRGLLVSLGILGYRHFEGHGLDRRLCQRRHDPGRHGSRRRTAYPGGKLFAGLYALYCGLIVVISHGPSHRPDLSSLSCTSFNLEAGRGTITAVQPQEETLTEIRQGEKLMPFGEYQDHQGRRQRRAKATLIREVTRLLAEVLGKNPQTTVVVIEEVDTDNWGSAAKTVNQPRQREQPERKLA